VIRRAIAPVVVSVLVIAAMFVFVFPTQTYLGQRASLVRAESQLHTLKAANQTLSAQAAQLRTPAAIERLAREDYGLVLPGQEAYAILPAQGSSHPSSSHPSSSHPSSSAPKPAIKAGAGSAQGSPAAGSGPTSSAGGAGPTAAAPSSFWGRVGSELTFWR
jgi:cell division protein FtsB